MQTHALRSVAGAGLALWLAVVACGGGSVEPTATAITRPTQRPKATETPVATATKASKPTKTPPPSSGDDEAVVSDGGVFTHDSGAFSVTFPKGWTINPKDNSVFVESPEKDAAIEVLAINTGFELNEQEFDNAIEAVEANWFATFEDYKRTEDKAPQEGGAVGVFKTLTLSSGTPQVVWSYYWQKDQALYEIDLWMDEDVAEDLQPQLLEVANSLEFDPEAVAQLETYQLVYTFTGPDNLFAFYVPYAWTYKQTVEGEAVLDKFTAPDEQSVVESIVDSSGRITSLEEARAETLSLLEQVYGVTEKDITKEEEQKDGSVRIDWETADTYGNTFYEVRDDHFIFLNWAVKSDLYDTYHAVWTQLLDSYGPPSEE